MDWEVIGKWVAGIVAALVASGVVVKLVVMRRISNRSSIRVVSQKNNIAGGDIVAGNSAKKIDS